jgi:hypothetical protein
MTMEQFLIGVPQLDRQLFYARSEIPLLWTKFFSAVL